MPMAGLGTRFSDCGYKTAKPLLSIHGIPMYQLVLANLLTDQIGRIALVTQAAWQLSKSISDLSKALDLEIELIEIDHVTQGPADSVQLAAAWLHPSEPVVTANSDQYVSADLRPFYEVLTTGGVAGALLLMEDDHPKWSYARLEHNHVVEVREKAVISRFATVGIYGYRTATIMLDAFGAMRDADDRVNGEFYVGPSYNYLQDRGEQIASTNLGPVSTVMYGLGTPDDFEHFVASDISRSEVERALSLGML